VLLQRVGHGIPPNHVKTVPNGCKKCHQDGGSAYPFATLIHSVHFDDPDQNAYVQDFDGSCIGCHRMNTDRGIVSVKRGPRNW
jgi:nitrate reductase cytochrome c-type subunit